MYTLKYRTFDELLEDVSVDFGAYSLEGMIEPQQLIKVALRVNYDLGLRIHQQREVILDIEKGKAKLPSDFYVLNFAYKCGRYEVKELIPSGTHIEEKILAPAADCIVNPPTTTTTTTSTTTETTGEGTPAVTQTIEHPATGGTFNSYSGDYTTQAIGAQTVYNPVNDEFLLLQAYSNPTILWAVSSADGTESSSITLNREYKNFVFVPGLNVFVAGSPDFHIGLFSATDYSLITEITMTAANGTGRWYLTYDAGNSCIWAAQQYNTKRHHKIAITSTSLTAGAYVDIDSFTSNNQNTALIYYQNNLYGFSYASSGSVSQGYNTDITVMPIVNGEIDVNNLGKYTNGNGIWYSAGYIYKPQPRGEKTVALDTETGLFWIRFDGFAAPVSYIFTWDPSDQSWTHIADNDINNYTDGSIVYDSYGKNIMYSGNSTTYVIRTSDNNQISQAAVTSSDIAVSSVDGNALLARGNSNTAYLMTASYTGGTEAWTETIVVTPAVPGETTSETVTTTTTSTSGVDELYQCQPEGTCLNQCGDYYQLIQKTKYETRVYQTFGALPIKASSTLDTACPNKCSPNSPNAAEIRDGFIKTPFETGQVYFNYQGAMENEDGQLMVLDHPLINEYYEYALKQRILESMYFAGEDVVQKMNLVEQRLRAARNNALSLVNMPNFAELKKIWEINRKAQYHKYVNMFKSYPVIQE